MPLIEQVAGRSSTTNDKLITKRTRRFVFRTFVVVLNSNVILAQNGVPRIGSPHPEDLGSRCTNVEARQTEAPLVWDIIAQYSSSFPDPERNQENPIQEPPLVSYSHSTMEITKFWDRNGDPFTSTAGQTLLSPPTISEVVQVLTIQNKQASFDRAIGFSYTNAINSTSWFGIKPKRARAMVAASEAFKNGVTYWNVTYRFEIRSDPWNPVRVANSGTMIKDRLHALGAIGNVNKLVMPKDTKGVAHGQEVFITEDGFDTIEPEQAALGNIHWLEFDVYEELDFAGLLQI